MGKASLPRGNWDLAHLDLGGVTGHGSAGRRERSLKFRVATIVPVGHAWPQASLRDMAWPQCSVSDSFPSALCREHHCWEACVPGQKDHPHIERAHQLQVSARPRARPPPPHLPVRAPAPWRQRGGSVPRTHPTAFRPRRHPEGNPTGSRYHGWGHSLLFSLLRSKSLRPLGLHICILFLPS